jgi:hypothetical protein
VQVYLQTLIQVDRTHRFLYTACSACTWCRCR